MITDLMLPGMAGEDGAPRARRGDMPVIVMSARTTAADKVALLKLGADDYLTKPRPRRAAGSRAGAAASPTFAAHPRPARLRRAPPEPAAAAAMRYKD
ncbi:MAG: response regulator [Eggerthella lenta]